jgi:peptide deformylase
VSLQSGDANELEIIQCGDPVLRREARPVDPSTLKTPEMQRLIEQMHVTMEAAPGVGLAAPQVAVPLQLAVLQDGPERWGHVSDSDRAARQRDELPFTVLVNPVVTPVDPDDLVTFYEGCLSVPGLTGAVARYRAVRVQALDECGQALERVFTGWPARIVQHEVDHLHGLLYLDRVETRSLSTNENYASRWAGRPPTEAAATLGFDLSQGSSAQ